MIIVVNHSGEIAFTVNDVGTDPVNLAISDGAETITFYNSDPEIEENYSLDIWSLAGDAPESNPIDASVSLAYISGNAAGCTVRLQDSTGVWRNATTEEVSGSIIRIMSMGK